MNIGSVTATVATEIGDEAQHVGSSEMGIEDA